MTDTYDRRTIVYHWASAALVLGLWIAGQCIDFFPKGTPRITVRSLHISVGVLLGALLLAPLAWRRGGGVKLPAADPGVSGRVAVGIHHLLYLLLCAAVVVGLACVWIRGDNLFNLFTVPAFDPGNRALAHQAVELHDRGSPTCCWGWPCCTARRRSGTTGRWNSAPARGRRCAEAGSAQHGAVAPSGPSNPGRQRVQPELVDHRLQLTGALRQGAGRGGGLLDHPGVVLGGLVLLRHRLVDLLDALRLRPAPTRSRVDLARGHGNAVGRVLDALNHVGHRVLHVAQRARQGAMPIRSRPPAQRSSAGRFGLKLQPGIRYCMAMASSRRPSPGCCR